MSKKLAKDMPSARYYPVLANSFSPVVMNALINNGHSKYLSEVLTASGILSELDTNINLREFFEWLYGFISDSYRNEYIYKNAIANKILLGRHSLNTSCMLSEFRVGNCKADVVILNDTSTVYEIKSEYDSFKRIESQIDSYMNVFDMINVITSSSQLSKLESLLPCEIGLMELTHNYTIRTVREAKSVKARVKPEIIFDSLRKPEYLSIINKIYGYIPDVPNTRIYKVCLDLFGSLPPEVAHDEMVRVLYKRGNKRALREFILSMPSCLRAYAISANLTIDHASKLNELLRNQLSTVLLPVH
jgi:hypothetical protein